MAYDDKDFQSPNLHLAGEGNNKFPPPFRSYALPKFDFDDTLHGGLRFDSLVETEVFLGIDNNEDNQWIEDFSRGHSGIHFNSGEVESCSILRRNNVWSEATSSESVEMMLKSVGQEEIVPVQTDNKESNACDELACIIKPMEPSLNQDNVTPSRMDDLSVSGLEPTLPPVDVLDSVCLLDDVEGLQPQVDTASQIRDGDASVGRGLDDLSSISVEDCLTNAEQSLMKDNTHNDVNQSRGDIAIGESLDDKAENASLKTQADHAIYSSHNATAGSHVLNNEDEINGARGTAEPKTDILETIKDDVSSQEFQRGDQVPDAILLEGAASDLDETSRIENNVSNVEGTSYIMAKGDSGLSDNLVIGDPPGINAHEGEEMGIRGNTLSEKYEVHDSSGSSMDNKNLVSDIVASPLSTEDKEALKIRVDGSNNGCAGGTSSLIVVSSSAELLSEMHAEGHVSSTTLANSKQNCERSIDSGQGDVHKCHQDVSLKEKESTEFCPDDSNMASNGGRGAEKKLIESELQPDTAAGNETGAVVDQGVVVMSPGPLVQLAHSEKGKDNEGTISSEASILDLKKSTQLGSGLDSAFESEKVLVGQIVCESADQSALISDGCKTESHGKAQMGLLNKDSQESTKEISESPAFSDSIANKRDAVTSLVKDIDEKESSKISELTVNNDGIPGTGPSAIEESGEGTNQKHQVENEAATVSGDIGKQIAVLGVKCGESGTNQERPVSVSPRVIRTTELSHDESNKGGVKAVSEVTDVDASKVSSSPGDSKLDGSSKDKFTFDVSPIADVSKTEPGKTWKPVSTAQASKVSPMPDASVSTSGIGQVEAKVTEELSHGSTKVSDRATARSGSNSNTERKSRRSSGKTTKESSKKGNPVKETASVKLERGERVTNVSLGPARSSQPVQLTEMQRFGHVNSSGIKPFVLTASTSSLPDLNFSASSSAMFQQPFTDLQQVQLRAQIFVYGALIQGTVPDEAYMISAFEGADGGRNIWENAWHSCIERLHGQKYHLVTPETPLQSRSGARAPEQPSKQGALHSKAVSPPIVRVSNRGTPTIINPVVPLSSPLWSLATPSADILQSSGLPRGPLMDYQCALSSLPSYQTPPVRSSVAHNPSWISQAPFCGPWAASSQNSALDASGRLSVQLPTTETVQLTPVKESSLPHSSGVKHGTALQSGASGAFAGISLAPDVQKVTTASGHPSSVLKPRKRKKTSLPETPGQNALHPQLNVEVGSASAAGSNLSASVSISTSVSFLAKAPTEKVMSSLSAITDDLRKGDQHAGVRTTLSEETLTKVKEARVHAEDAAAFAASAVIHSQELWVHLDKQRKSGLLPDTENKLASAAAAAAAAVTVAKAAAAAANVASNAALQAKLVADEAISSGGYSIPGQNYLISFSDGTKNLEKATPASILKGDDGTSNSSSVILAAREAAMRRVEAVSAASKQAENMDAIVKAAELAAVAVSQAGKIVAMGDRLSLNEVVTTALECNPKVTSELFPRSKEVGRENLNINSAGGGTDISSRQDPSKEEVHSTNFVRSSPRETPCEDDVRLVDVITGSGTAGAKDSRGQKGRKGSDLAKTIGVVPEPENGLRSSPSPQNENGKAEETAKGNSIKEGSHVEVFKNGNGFKSAWFLANVLSMKDGKAYVAYDELTTGEGMEKLKEWVPLSSEGDAAPKIRIARLVAAVPFEGTRKRRRAAMGDYTWSVGDRVDAWIRDSWWEGVITEKSKKDETLITVHFPAQGETSVVKAWHLRSSLVWKDGEWIEWSSSRESSHITHGGDTPQEKRPRLRSPAVEAKGKDKMPKSVDAKEPDKPNEPTLLAIAADEKLFNIGKSTRDESKPDRLRMTRTGLPKEGSRVIFGVPKPGKKRKFMEVSKHYVADRSGKTNEAKDPAKLAKYTMPQVSGTRGLKSTSKPESNEKRAISKPRVVKSGKQQNIASRSIPQKNLLSSRNSAGTEVANTDHASKTKDSLSHAEDTLEKRNLTEFQSFSSSEGGAEGPVLFSSLSLPSDSLSSKKVSSNTRAERVSKGKLAPAGGKLGKIEEGKVFSGNSAKPTSDVVEPRRSNRRIQPTSRLLEGLQSSLMVAKIPSVSHDKTHKSRNGSRGNKHD
uniref:Uncharacterized protein LOC105632277 isoform X1 n=2 Tax=Rhizophora mucronata TaxID=61149 RepID=A0A2P2M6W7_RHIMU